MRSVDPNPDSESGSRRPKEGKMTHINRKKVKKFLCFEVLDVLFWGLKASSVTWTSFMEA
jgi:hypothetical protein